MAPPRTGPASKGSRLVRGPMAGDHYTRIHNIAVRGAIPTRYVGVFGFISSHEQGWMLTTAGVATALNVGPDFVTAALHAIEEAGCLIRGRERDAAGKVRGSVWFITDLPFQLRQLGIDDPAVIDAQVRAAYDKWLAEAGADDNEDQGDNDQETGEPDRENPILGVTSENAAADEGFRRSEPNPGFPDQAQPSQAQPVHKKTKVQEQQGLEDQEEEPPPTPRGTTAAPAADRAATGGSLDEATRATLNDAAEAAAAVRTGAKGWKPAQVRAAIRDALDGGHPPALVAERLAQIAADTARTTYPTRLRTVLDLAAAEAARKAAQPAAAPTPPWVEGPFKHLDRDAPRCRKHPGNPAKGCGGCKADQVAADPGNIPVQRLDGEVARQAAAAAIAAGRRNVKAKANAKARPVAAMDALAQVAAEVTAPAADPAPEPVGATT